MPLPKGFAKLSEEERKAAASRGGKANVAKSTPEQLSARGRKGAVARRKKMTAKEKAEFASIGGKARWQQHQKDVEDGTYKRGGESAMGFAALDEDEQKNIASKGGKNAQKKRTPEERAKWAREGGKNAQENRTPEERIAIGKLGGAARWEGLDDVIASGRYKEGGAKPMGFAALSPEKRKAIASRGGQKRAENRAKAAAESKTVESESK